MARGDLLIASGEEREWSPPYPVFLPGDEVTYSLMPDVRCVVTEMKTVTTADSYQHTYSLRWLDQWGEPRNVSEVNRYDLSRWEATDSDD